MPKTINTSIGSAFPIELIPVNPCYQVAMRVGEATLDETDLAEWIWSLRNCYGKNVRSIEITRNHVLGNPPTFDLIVTYHDDSVYDGEFKSGDYVLAGLDRNDNLFFAVQEFDEFHANWRRVP